jgi:hypothetical protein
VLLLLLYLSLDFTNPMMPGAVTFDPAESVEGVRIERVRSDAIPGLWAPSFVCPVVDRSDPPRPACRPSPAGQTARDWIVPVRRSLGVSADPVAADDTH